jgi:putative heme iron utilization protein
MGRNIMAKNLDEFLKDFKSLTISTIDEKQNPFSSYAPFVKVDNKYYVYISQMAKHTQNLTNNDKCSLFFIEDESECKNLFARKRVMIQCTTKKIDQDGDNENSLLNEFRNKFGEEMINMLKNMNDFHVFEFKPFYGEAVFGFGKAYNLGGEGFNDFVQREASNTKGHGHGSKD